MPKARKNLGKFVDTLQKQITVRHAHLVCGRENNDNQVGASNGRADGHASPTGGGLALV
jgi:hypothetical protein